MTTLENISRQIRQAGMAAEQKVTPLENEDNLPGGRADNVPNEKFDPKQLEIGIKVEMEHTKDAAIAEEIAKDHLTEDPEYYSKLEKMEEENKDFNPQIFSKFCARPMSRLSKSGIDQTFEHRGFECKIRWTSINEKGTDTQFWGTCPELNINTRSYPTASAAKAAVKKEVEQNEEEATRLGSNMTDEEWKKQKPRVSSQNIKLWPAVVKGRQIWVSIPEHDE